MEATQPADGSATETAAQSGRPLTVVTVGLLVFAAALLFPTVKFPGLQKWVLLLVGAPLCVLSLVLREQHLRSASFRSAVGLLFVLVYLHARSALLPEAWVPKNEWDEAWRIPWVTIALALLAPFWIAHWLGGRGRGEAAPAQRAWTIAGAFVAASALVMFAVLSRAYPEAITFGYTLSVSLQAVEAALVFAMAAAERRPPALRLLLVLALAASLAKATVT